MTPFQDEAQVNEQFVARIKWKVFHTKHTVVSQVRLAAWTKCCQYVQDKLRRNHSLVKYIHAMHVNFRHKVKFRPFLFGWLSQIKFSL